MTLQQLKAELLKQKKQSEQVIESFEMWLQFPNVKRELKAHYKRRIRVLKKRIVLIDELIQNLSGK